MVRRDHLPDIGVHEAVVLVQGRVKDAAKLQDASVVHQDVQLPILLESFLNDALCVPLISQVGCMGNIVARTKDIQNTKVMTRSVLGFSSHVFQHGTAVCSD